VPLQRAAGKGVAKGISGFLGVQAMRVYYWPGCLCDDPTVIICRFNIMAW
jgi:hypothetical protein